MWASVSGRVISRVMGAPPGKNGVRPHPTSWRDGRQEKSVIRALSHSFEAGKRVSAMAASGESPSSRNRCHGFHSCSP
jgi:hypothetical protein